MGIRKPRHTGRLSRCGRVYQNIRIRCTSGIFINSSSPEDISLMLLTIFELWVALDKIVVAQHPLLTRYSPEVKPQLLESSRLLLPKFEQLQRLALIEKYLRRRHTMSEDRSSIFSDVDIPPFCDRTKGLIIFLFIDVGALSLHSCLRLQRPCLASSP